MTLLAGKAKTGKSYLIFNIALGISLGDKALGHFPVNQKEILYLALEDSLRRIKQRGNKLIAEIPRGFHISTEWAPGKQGVEAVKKYIEHNPGIGVVIVDTLAMVRD